MELRSKYFSFSNSVYDVFVAQKKLFEQPTKPTRKMKFFDHHSFHYTTVVVFRFLSLTFFWEKKYFKRHLLVVPTMRVFARSCIIQPWYTQNRKRWTNSSFVRKKRVDSTTNTNIIIITFAPLFQMAATFLHQCWKNTLAMIIWAPKFITQYVWDSVENERNIHCFYE